MCTTSYASASLFADTLLCSKPLVCTANIVSRATVSPRNTHRPRGPSPPYRTIQLVHACGRHKTPAQDYVTTEHVTDTYILSPKANNHFSRHRGAGGCDGRGEAPRSWRESRKGFCWYVAVLGHGLSPVEGVTRVDDMFILCRWIGGQNQFHDPVQ